MSLYHSAAFTLDPERAIPPDAAPALAISQTGQADALAAYSAEHVAGRAIALTSVVVSGSYVTVTLDYHSGSALPEGSEIEWDWGDGSWEVGHDTLQGHAYGGGGSFQITATLRRTGQPSVQDTLLVVL